MEWFYSNEMEEEDGVPAPPTSSDFVLVDSEGTPVPAGAEASYLMHQALAGNLDALAANEEGYGTVEHVEVEDEWAAKDDFEGMGNVRERLSALYLADDEPRQEEEDATPAPPVVEPTATKSDAQEQEEVEEGMEEQCSRQYTDGEEDWILESILQRRSVKGEVQYLCKWKWYREPTWELRSLLEEEGYVSLLTAFDTARQALKKKAPPPKPKEQPVPELFSVLPNLLNQIEELASAERLHLKHYAPVNNKELQRNFFRKWNQCPDSKLKILFHGTRLCNFSSIERGGLIIPGHRGVRVANGSAHGVGIYTAKNPGYSTSYGESNCMFVCIGLVSPRYTSIKDHYSICVFFDETLVIPVLAVQFERILVDQQPPVEHRSIGAFLNAVSPTGYQAQQHFPTGYSPVATLTSYAERGMTKKMLKQAPKSVKELYKAGLLRQKRH